MSTNDFTYGCKGCETEVAKSADIISRNFRGFHGRAVLIENVSNITTADQSEERQMTTGLHVVHDIACKQCKETIGWMYEKAYEESEKYKEGKFILEIELLKKKEIKKDVMVEVKQPKGRDWDAASTHSKL